MKQTYYIEWMGNYEDDPTLTATEREGVKEDDDDIQVCYLSRHGHSMAIRLFGDPKTLTQTVTDCLAGLNAHNGGK